MNNFGLNFSIYTDPLSLLFVFVIGLISIPSAVYSVGYLKGYSPAKRLRAWVLLLIFVLAMAAVVTAANALFFLIAWEAMSLVSYFLVIFNSEDPKSVKAGIIYLVMTHIGTAFITVAFLTMHRYAGSFDIVQMKAGSVHGIAGIAHLDRRARTGVEKDCPALAATGGAGSPQRAAVQRDISCPCGNHNLTGRGNRCAGQIDHRVCLGDGYIRGHRQSSRKGAPVTGSAIGGAEAVQAGLQLGAEIDAGELIDAADGS